MLLQGVLLWFVEQSHFASAALSISQSMQSAFFVHKQCLGSRQHQGRVDILFESSLCAGILIAALIDIDDITCIILYLLSTTVDRAFSYV